MMFDNRPVESAFLLAAGKGERLRPLTDNIPKPLLKIDGRPIVSHVLENLRSIPTLKRVVLNAWYHKDQIKEYARSEKSNWPFEILVSEEDELLGTAGGLKKALPLLGSAPFLSLNGDCLFKGDLSRFIEQANGVMQNKASLIWWLCPEEPKQTRIGHRDGEIISIGSLYQKPSTTPAENFGCFSGIQLIRDVEASLLPDKGCLIRNYLLQRLQNPDFKMGAVDGGFDFWTDIGTPERFAEASRPLRSPSALA